MSGIYRGVCTRVYPGRQGRPIWATSTLRATGMGSGRSGDLAGPWVVHNMASTKPQAYQTLRKEGPHSRTVFPFMILGTRPGRRRTRARARPVVLPCGAGDFDRIPDTPRYSQGQGLSLWCFNITIVGGPLLDPLPPETSELTCFTGNRRTEPREPLRGSARLYSADCRLSRPLCVELRAVTCQSLSILSWVTVGLLYMK